MRWFKNITILLTLIGLGFVFYFLHALHNQITILSDELLEIDYKLAEAQKVSLSKQNNAVIFLIKNTPTDFLLVPVNRPISSELTPQTALETLIKGPLPNEKWHESIPRSTKLIGLSVYNGLATANFSKEIQTDFNGGSLIESLLVQAIVNTLTEFSEITQVQILVNGEVVESIGGHVYIGKPLSRNYF